MKTLKLILIGLTLILAVKVSAQVSLNINVGSPPNWGPAGYSNVEYYYLPDVHAYYDVPSSKFIYYEGGVWVHRSNLPHRYRNYNLYDGYKVVLTDYHGKTPYTYYKQHKVKYAKGYRGPKQQNIGPKPGKGNSGAGVNSGNRSYKNSPAKSSSNQKQANVRKSSSKQGGNHQSKGGNGKRK